MAENDSSCKLFRSLKCFHIPFSLHEPNYFCTDLHSNGPDNFLMSNPNQGSSVELGLLWFGFTQHVWNTLLRFLSTGFNIKWVSRVGIRWPSLKPSSDCSATVRPCITLTWLPTTSFPVTTSSGYIISFWRQLKVLYCRKGGFHVFVFFFGLWSRSGHCLITVQVLTNMAVVVKAPTELMWKSSGWWLLRSVRAGQSELTGLFRCGTLKRPALKLTIHI